MIYKHIGIVKEISRVGLPGFQSKDRVEAGLTSLYMNFSSSPLREDEDRTQEEEERKTQRQFVRQTQTPRKTQVFFTLFIFFLYI
jgi:hypothetical protein